MRGMPLVSRTNTQILTDEISGPCIAGSLLLGCQICSAGFDPSSWGKSLCVSEWVRVRKNMCVYVRVCDGVSECVCACACVWWIFLHTSFSYNFLWISTDAFSPGTHLRLLLLEHEQRGTDARMHTHAHTCTHINTHISFILRSEEAARTRSSLRGGGGAAGGGGAGRLQSSMASSWSARSSNMFPMSSRMFPAASTVLLPVSTHTQC